MTRTPGQQDVVDRARAVVLPRAFKRHGGKTLGFIVDNDPGYIAFLAGIRWERRHLGDAVSIVRLAYADAVSQAQNAREMLR